ncbi:MAG: hypothetical protein LBJ02_01720 [Bifidobacteriaceae bacterium]|jgi:hypothetical protein|nr:hypothetical protein [Bifidobacteriaceae bacterium]
MKYQRALVALTAAATFALAGCSSSDGAASPSGDADNKKTSQEEQDLAADLGELLEGDLEPAHEMAFKQLELDATVKWINCARKNGYPNMKDPGPLVADQYATKPTAVLPRDITEDAFRALLAACPNFNEQAHEAADKESLVIWEKNGNTLPSREESVRIQQDLAKKYPDSVDPNIGFDVPGWDGTDGELDASTEELDRLGTFLGILSDPAWAYAQKHIEDIPPINPE